MADVSLTPQPTTTQKTVVSEYYGKSQNTEAEKKAQQALTDFINAGVQAGTISNEDAGVWKNQTYINAIAYGGYTPQDIVNDQYARRTKGTGGIVHPTISRTSWFSSLQKDGSTPPTTQQEASDFAGEQQSKDTDQAKEIVDTFTEGSLSYDEFQKSQEAKDIESEMKDFFQKEFGIAKEDFDLRQSRLKEDFNTTLERLLEDKGFFGEEVQLRRQRLDEDKAKAIETLGLKETRGKEDYDRALRDLADRRGDLTADQDRALRGLAIQERDETEGLQENLNQRNIFGAGIGDILRGRLAEKQGLRREGVESEGERALRDLGKAQEQTDVNYARFGEDINQAKAGTETQYARQFEDLDRQLAERNRQFGRTEEDIRKENTRQTFDLQKALDRQKQAIEQEQQQATQEEQLQRYGEQLLQPFGAV